MPKRTNMKQATCSPIIGRKVIADFESRTITITPAPDTPAISAIGTRLLHYTEVEQILAVSRWKRYKLQKEGKLTPVNFNRSTWYNKAEVETLMKERMPEK